MNMFRWLTWQTVDLWLLSRSKLLSLMVGALELDTVEGINSED